MNEIPSEQRLDQESGLYTQAIMQALLRHEVARIKRYPAPLSLMYVALQFPKPPSEEIYRSAHLFLANILQSKLREVDMPGHFEGNYLVALPNTDKQGTRTAATRLIHQARGKQISRTAIEYTVSICIGITSHAGGETISLAEILSQAASALWEAERRGPESMACYDEISVK